MHYMYLYVCICSNDQVWIFWTLNFTYLTKFTLELWVPEIISHSHNTMSLSSTESRTLFAMLTGSRLTFFSKTWNPGSMINLFKSNISAVFQSLFLQPLTRLVIGSAQTSCGNICFKSRQTSGYKKKKRCLCLGTKNSSPVQCFRDL